ncbi:MAG: MFS transporter [Rubrobacteraceae bacterium]
MVCLGSAVPQEVLCEVKGAIERVTKSSLGLVPAGLAMIAVTYGLARFAYGLFLPEFRETFELDAAVLGLIGSGSYAGYCAAITISLIYTSKVGSRFMAAAAGLTAVVGMALVATAPGAPFLAAGVLIAGSSTGLASPPMAEAVSRAFDGNRQDRANTLINSGTSVGVALSGPVALVAAGQWRLAWIAFAAVGLAVLVWNLAAMPTAAPNGVGESSEEDEPNEVEGREAIEAEKPPPEKPPQITFGWLVGLRSLPLFLASVGLGLASAAYWTFSRDLVVQAGGLSQTGSTTFWVVLGISGLLGGAAGDLVGRFGLGVALRGALFAMAASIGMLAVAPGALIATYPSAAFFGATYIMLTGILLVWAVRVFRDRPSAGLGAAFLLIAAGQILGSYTAGIIAGSIGLQNTFAIFAGVAILSMIFGPRGEDS